MDRSEFKSCLNWAGLREALLLLDKPTVAGIRSWWLMRFVIVKCMKIRGVWRWMQSKYHFLLTCGVAFLGDWHVATRQWYIYMLTYFISRINVGIYWLKLYQKVEIMFLHWRSPNSMFRVAGKFRIPNLKVIESYIDWCTYNYIYGSWQHL